MGSNRTARIARVIREEASRVILYELSDPRIGFVTVTKVKVSGDLSLARVYVSILGDDGDRDKTMDVLGHAARIVQRAVAPRLRTRIIPHISFQFDASVEGTARLSRLIREARATDADGGLSGPPSGGDDGADVTAPEAGAGTDGAADAAGERP